MLTSSNFKKSYTSKTARSKTSTNFYRKNKKITENQLAIEETKKLYQKYYASPSTMLLSQLKTETINLYLDIYKFNDITVICRLLNKYFYFKYMTLAPYDPMKKSPKSRRSNAREPITDGERVKMEKEKRDQEIEFSHIINKITLGIGKHLSLTDNLIALTLVNLELDQKLAQNLSKGIIENKSIHALSINNCKMSIEVYEILLKGLLNHEKIEYLDLHNNNLGDKYGNMIGRVIARQTYRRDQEIWLYGLRNEFPETNDYTLGLISINLDGNQLSSYSADCITTSLSSDQYVRSIILSNNNFDKNSCKKFIYMLRRNMTLLNIDLRDNPGYDDNIKTRLIMKMSKNIRNLYIQFKAKVYTDKEFQNYKKFIDTSFFDLDIPEEIIEFYNNNFQKITEGNLTYNNINNINNKNKNNNTNNINKVMSDIQEEEKEYTNSNVSKNSLSLLTINSKNKNKNKMVKKNSKNNNSVSEKENKKLMEENLLLKKQILELKAENVQKKLGKNLNIPNVYNMENLKKNYKIADELFDKLNEVMNTMGNENDNNNKINNKINVNINEKNNKIIENKNEINLNDKKNESIKNINNIIEKELEKENGKVKEKEKEKEKENNIIINKNNEKKKVIEVKIEKVENEEKEKKEEKEENGKKEIKNEIIQNDKKDEKNNDEELKEGEEFMDDLNEDDYTMLQHQHFYEQLKKEYDAKGLKFDIEDYMELLQNAAEQEEEEGENEDI